MDSFWVLTFFVNTTMLVLFPAIGYLLSYPMAHLTLRFNKDQLKILKNIFYVVIGMIALGLLLYGCYYSETSEITIRDFALYPGIGVGSVIANCSYIRNFRKFRKKWRKKND